MDQNTRFLIKRMDEMEHRLMSKIDPLWAVYYKILGASTLAGVVGGLLFKIAERIL